MSKPDRDWQLLRDDLRDAMEAARDALRAVGDMGNKWGSYTEGLAAPAVERVLREEFGAEIVLQHVSASRAGENQEFDLIGIVNGKKNEVMLAEIKSRLTEGELKKFEKNFADFFHFFPEHKGKKLRGMLVAVAMPESMPQRVANRGFYLMRSHRSNFDLVDPPAKFQPRTLKA